MHYKILVIEDESTMRRLIGMLLSRKGHHVIEADNGETGIEMALDHAPDIILLDIMMPLVDGFETLRRLRANPQTEAIPVIFLSAKSQVEDRIEGLRLGADDYIVKPADPDELEARIEAVMARARRAPVRRRGKVIGFVGAKGGVGTTTAIANFGIFLQQSGANTVLVDLHLAFGNLADLLGAAEERQSTAELATFPPNQIDPSVIERVLINHPSGLRVLASPAFPPAGITYSAEHLMAILDQVAYLSEIILLDLPTDPDIVEAIADKLDGIVLVVGDEPACLWTAHRLAQHVANLGQFKKLSVLQIRRERLDRFYITETSVTKSLNCPFLGTLPPAPESYREAEHRRAPAILVTMGPGDKAIVDKIAQKLLNYDQIVGEYQKEAMLRSRNLA
jgi:DNA-binding response OmpR family regulator